MKATAIEIAENSKRPARCALRIARTGGFTLLEAMIVVGLIGILAAIALPSYLQYVRKANRADAKSILMETAQWMERFYTTNGGVAYTGAPTSPPPISAVSPKGANGSGIMYNISFVALPSTTYTVQAVPANSQASDSCGTLTVTNTGATTPTSGCW